MAYHHGNLKESLIQAADVALKIYGIEGLSLRAVAQQAGVSHNAPYRHFRDKDDLIDHIVERTFVELSEQILTAPLFYPSSILLQAQFVGRLWMNLAIRHPRKARLLFTGSGAPKQKFDQLQDISGTAATQDNDTKNDRTLFKGGHRLIHLNLTTILEAASPTELSSDVNCKSLALILNSTFRGLGLFYITHAADDLLPSEDILYDMSDLATENILRSVMA